MKQILPPPHEGKPAKMGDTGKMGQHAGAVGSEVPTEVWSTPPFHASGPETQQVPGGIEDGMKGSASPGKTGGKVIPPPYPGKGIAPDETARSKAAEAEAFRSDRMQHGVDK